MTLTANLRGRSYAMSLRLALACVLMTSACMSGAARKAELMLASGDPDGAAEVAAEHIAAHPGDRTMRRIHVMALADAERRPAAVVSYAQWFALYGHDKVMLEDLAILTLRSRLGAATPEVRIAAIGAVEALEIDALADDVAKRMNDREPEVAAHAAIAVLRGYADSIAAMRDLISSGDERARAVVVAGLARKVGTSALPIIVEHRGDNAAAVRVEVARALGQSREAAMRAHLVGMLGDADPTVVAAAVAALGKSEACADIALVRAQFLPRLATLSDHVVRAMLGLGCAKDPLAADWVSAASADPKLSVRVAAARAPVASPAVAAALAKALIASASADDRRHGLALRDRLAKADQALVTSAARRFVADPDPWLALIAGDVLAASREPGDADLAATAYGRALSGPSDVVLAAATTLALRGDAAALTKLAPFAAGQNAAVAARAVHALAMAPRLPLSVVQALASDDARAVAAARGILRYLDR